MGHFPNRAGRRRDAVLAARPRLESLEARENPTVNYFGGNLLTNVEAQPVYYGSAWSSDPTTQAYTDSFLKDVTGGAYVDALTRAGYGVGRGTATDGIVDPVSLTPNATITDASIQARLAADVSSGLLPAPDANRLYVVYVQPNVAVNLGAGQGTTTQGVLGYHGAFAGANGATIRYAVIAYPGGTVHNSSLGIAANDQLTSVTSHELAEAVTDPDVNFSRLGWYDTRRGEIGDITENNPAAQVRLDGYLVQEVADKNDQLLPIFTSPPPVSPPPVSPPPVSPPPVSPPPVTPPTTTTTTTTTLTAGPVRYFGWFATESLTVTVRPTSGTALPGGSVRLIYNGQVLGIATLHLVNGVETATFNVTYFANGLYVFSAQYVGGAAFAPSTSGAVGVLV
jgi:hypothetical protein